jgi:uncharacterized membrane protein YciS (DUF1049 family)
VPAVNELLGIIEGNPLGIALAILGLVGFLRGWIVPGYIYTATNARLDKVLEGLATVTAAVKDLTDEIRSDRRAH